MDIHEKFTYAEGWNYEKVMEQIRKYNNGTKATIRGHCTYQAPDGNRCAIGCFIPGTHGGMQFPGSVVALLKAYPELEEVMPIQELDGLLRFQETHDRCYELDLHATISDFLKNNVR